MIFLTLRTDKPESELGLYEDGKQLAYIKWEAHRQLAETLHHKIQDILRTQHQELSSLDGIITYAGPGSFTGLRIGISVANALSYGLDIPIIGSQGEDWLKKGLVLIKSSDSKLPLTPFYGSDAHITTPKK